MPARSIRSIREGRDGHRALALGRGALAVAIRTGRISSREATQAVLGRLQAVNPKLNAVTVLLADQALTAAERAVRVTSSRNSRNHRM